MKLKKILALTTALAMSLSMATTAFATGTSGSGSGTGALEGTVNTDVFEVAVPSSATLNFFADPEGLIEATGAAKYEGADIEEDASLYFDNSVAATVEVTVMTDENPDGEALQLPLYAEADDAETQYVLYEEEHYLYQGEGTTLDLTSESEDPAVPEEPTEAVVVMNRIYKSTSVDVQIQNKSSVEVRVSVSGSVTGVDGIALANTAEGIDEAVNATMYLALVYGKDDTVQALAATEATVTEDLAAVAEENWQYTYDAENGYQYVRDPEFDEFPTFAFNLTGASGGDWSALESAAPEIALTWSVEVKPASYTVSFNLNGQDGSVDAQNVLPGGTATVPEAPVAEGKNFGGWYTEAECTNAFDFETEITGNITLYAKWVEGPVLPTIANITGVASDASSVVITISNLPEGATINTFKYKNTSATTNAVALAATYRTLAEDDTITVTFATFLNKVKAGEVTCEVTFKDAEGVVIQNDEGETYTARFTISPAA